jgi:hypothetical protein
MDLRSLFGYRLLLSLKPRDFAEEMQEKLRGFTRLVVAAAIAKTTGYFSEEREPSLLPLLI